MTSLFRFTLHSSSPSIFHRLIRRLSRLRACILVLLLLAMPIGGALAETSASSSGLFGGLPLDLAIKQVRGNGMRKLVVFDDPNCTYCKRLAAETADITDVTIYTFLYPILSTESEKIAADI